jgi:protein-tyrosine kinase
MARMLQALKNLEARTSPPEPRPEAHAVRPQRPARQVIPAQPTQIQVQSPLLPQCSTLVIETAMGAGPSSFGSVFVSELAPLQSTPATSSQAHLEPNRPTTSIRSNINKPTSIPLEQSVYRTLRDPLRSEPLRQLADRIRRDAERSESKTALLVGIESQGAVHLPLLYAAALVAETDGEVLVIDADLNRRSLSNGLGAAHEPGLAELLSNAGPVRDRVRLTGLTGVSLLPAGRVLNSDLSTRSTRLEEILRNSTSDYALVLIDGGCSTDPAASTLARLCDMTYFVVRLGAVESGPARVALQEFRAAGARVLGCIAT